MPDHATPQAPVRAITPLETPTQSAVDDNVRCERCSACGCKTGCCGR